MTVSVLLPSAIFSFSNRNGSWTSPNDAPQALPSLVFCGKYRQSIP